MSESTRALRIPVFLLLFLSVSAFLVSQIYFGITPIRVEHSGKRGDSITDVFYVRNNAASPLRLRVYTENWILQEDGTPVFIGSQSAPFSCKDWITVNPQDFRLLPNEVKMVRYTVSIPEQAAAAGYHASVSFENVPLNSEEAKKNRMLFTGKIAAVVYVKVGDVKPQAEILDVLVSRETDTTYFTLLIKNTGKTHFRTKGVIELKNSRQETINQVTIPNTVVLPEIRRKIKCVLDKGLEEGFYEAFLKLDIGRKELLGFVKEFSIKNEK